MQQGKLTDLEKRRLALFEEEIQQNIEPLRSVLTALGPISKKMEDALPALTALKGIKEEGLYKGFKTWENYCKYWQIDLSVRHVDRLLDWADTVEKIKKVRPKGLKTPSERQARELRDLSPDEAAEVWAEVSGSGNPTAKKVRAAARKKTQSRIDAMPAAEQKKYIESRQQQALAACDQQELEDQVEHVVQELGKLFRKTTASAATAPLGELLRDCAVKACELTTTVAVPTWTKDTKKTAT